MIRVSRRGRRAPLRANQQASHRCIEIPGGEKTRAELALVFLSLSLTHSAKRLFETRPLRAGPGAMMVKESSVGATPAV